MLGAMRRLMEAKMKLIRWIIVLSVFSGQTYALAQDAKLVDAAKKEGGKVVIYGSLETPVVEGVIQAFRKRTGITAEYWRASAMSVMNRAMTEYRAGKPGYDVLLNNSDPLVIMANDGMIAKYDSPTTKKYPKDQIDPRLGPITRYGIVGIVYHKGLVKAEDAPKSIEDLVNPKYKGMLVMADPTLHVTTIQWLSSLNKIMAKEKGDKTFVKFAYSAAQSGAPVDYVRVDRMLGDSHFVVLGNKAPHSNSGKAFVDFYLDDESMKILAQSGEFVNRKGIYPPLPGAEKIQYVQMEVLEAKVFEDKKKEFEKIFLR